MITLPVQTRIWIAAGVTDLRRGFTGLSALVQTALEQDPFSGHVFAFRGRRGDLIKLLWWDGDGLCLFAKRLERGRFLWPKAESGTVALTRAQLSTAEALIYKVPACGREIFFSSAGYGLTHHAGGKRQGISPCSQQLCVRKKTFGQSIQCG
jgi:transposase